MLFISDVYFPRVNGVSTSIRTFREDLGAQGVETRLVVPAYDRAQDDEPGVTRVPASPIPGDAEDRRMHWGALKAVLDGLPPESFDLVHVHTPFYAHYAGVRLARRTQLPVMATYHTFFEEYLHHYIPALPRSIGRRIARSFTRSQCDDMQALIAPSEPMRDVLQHDYRIATPIHVVPTGLPLDRFQAGDGARFRRQMQIPLDRPLMVYVGRVAYEKNIDFLVNAYREVRTRLPRAMLLIAGEGPARASLTARVAAEGLASDVCFAGYLDRQSTLLDCYAAGDVFVFASRTETQGLVLLEAMAQGVPVVSTAVLGTRSILKEGSGALVVEENPGAFASAVVKVLTTDALRAQLSEAGRAYARTWSSPAMAARLKDVYESLHGAHHGAHPAHAPVRA